MTAAGPGDTFSPQRRAAWLRLWRSENVGPRTFQTLLSRFGSAEAALEALPDLVRGRTGGRPIRIAAADDIAREMETAERLGAVFLCRDEPGYPKLLRHIDSAPAVIAVQGRAEILDRPAVAIVGSRNASAAGLAFAERLARGLAQAGYVVVSGFARGIDSRAHRASLATGTVAVLAGGLDKIYPADAAPFMADLLGEGAAVSEMPFGWEPRGRDFPRRNRIVSALALGVVVVEAARRSGSLITARFAADQGREVFAVPGSPLDPRAEGTNDLLRDGATLCAELDDVLRALAGRTIGTEREPDLFRDDPVEAPDALWTETDLFDTLDAAIGAVEAPAGPAFHAAAPVTAGREHGPKNGAPIDAVVEAMGPVPMSLDELSRMVALPVRDVRAIALELEMLGRIERHGGGLISLIMPA